MKEYKENFSNAIDYAVHKLENSAFKMILLGFLGSLYVGIAYLVFILILGSWDGVIQNWEFDENNILTKKFSISIPSVALFTAAALFPVGIMLILFLGGSLFTSDNLTMLAWITKRKVSNGENVKMIKIFVKWMYTLLGNILGGLFFGAITRACNFFGNENYQLVLGYLCGKKIALEWYYTIVSGFLCNILVAGSVWASFAAKHSSAKIFLIYFPIWLFAIAGFQHVVANGILFSMSLFYMINPNEQQIILQGINYSVNHHIFEDFTGKSKDQIKNIFNENIKNIWIYSGSYIFKLFFANLIPAALGNWISGSLFLPYVYYYLSGHKKNSKRNIHNL